MEKLLTIRQQLTDLIIQINEEPSTLNMLYAQKSLEEASFWIGKELVKYPTKE